MRKQPTFLECARQSERKQWSAGGGHAGPEAHSSKQTSSVARVSGQVQTNNRLRAEVLIQSCAARKSAARSTQLDRQIDGLAALAADPAQNSLRAPHKQCAGEVISRRRVSRLPQRASQPAETPGDAAARSSVLQPTPGPVLDAGKPPPPIAIAAINT